MAFDAGSVVVYFKAQTAELIKGIEETNQTLDKFKKGIEGLGAFEVFESMKDAIFDCVNAASEAEVNVRKLQAAASSGADVETFKQLAEHLSEVTTFSNEAAMSSLALLGKFNLTDQQMGAMLPKIADFAAFMGQDLPSAAEAAGRAIANGSSGLRGLGLAFSDSQKKAFEMASQQDRVNILLDKMGEKFGGVAAAVAASGAGGMTQYHNAVEEVEKALGSLVESGVGEFFGGLATIIRGVASDISGMSDTMQTVVAVVGTVITGFVAATTATLAWGAAMKFLDGAPSVLASIAKAAGTVASTLMTVIAPLAVITSTVIMLEGMISRIQAGNFDSSESFIDGIKNNFKAGLEDIRSSFASVFESPKSSSAALNESLKTLDNTVRNVAKSVATLDFKSELEKKEGDPFEHLGNSIGLDFSKHVDANGVALTGNALTDDETSDAKNSKGLGQTVDASLVPDGSMMSKASIDAKATELKNSISGTDVAIAGVEGGLSQLAGKMGGASSVIATTVSKLATGDVAGAMVNLGVEMLSRTKSFGALLKSVEGIFTSVSQALDPIVAAVLPFLDIVSELLPVFMALDFPLKILGVTVKAIGDLLKSFIEFIGGFWNGLVETIASFVSKIPFIGDDIADWIRQAKIQAPADDSGLQDATKDATTNVTGLGDAAAKTSEQLLNVPEGFKVAAARYAAIIRGEGDPGATAAATTSTSGTTTMSVGELIRSKSAPILTAPLRGMTDTVATRHASTSTVPTINVQNLNVTSSDPDAVSTALAKAAKQSTFLRTGQPLTGDTTRGFWGA